jgi:hypothetical protein
MAAIMSPAFVKARLEEKDSMLDPSVLETLHQLKRAHFPNPPARPGNIHHTGRVYEAATPIVASRHEPHIVNGKQHMQQTYVLRDPENPDSLKKLLKVPVMLHRGMDRKVLKKALYNDRRLAKGRWVN